MMHQYECWTFVPLKVTWSRKAWQPAYGGGTWISVSVVSQGRRLVKACGQAWWDEKEMMDTKAAHPKSGASTLPLGKFRQQAIPHSMHLYHQASVWRSRQS
jgi:malate synthase